MTVDRRSSPFRYTLLGEEQRLRLDADFDGIVACVDDMLYEGLVARASDIHVHATHTDLSVRFRIDGVLREQPAITRDHALLVISRIKVLAGLDIAQRHLPQDGRFSVVCELDDSVKHVVDIRVATFPTTRGEKIVIRLLDRLTRGLDITQLGFSSLLTTQLQECINGSPNFFLITGPTGCGKTTTLYALISMLNSGERNIVTMEDPVEYDLDGVVQSQVNPKVGFTFANGLRSMLRQDPDVIMIGEVRDVETLSMALESSLTGHLVLSTLHTTRAVGALLRLVEMGVEPFLINAALGGVLSQRLVRRLCDTCKVKAAFEHERKYISERYGWDLTVSYKPRGCIDCFDTGYVGRVAVGEFLLMTDKLRLSIMRRAGEDELQQCARDGGMIAFNDDLREKVNQGLVSLEDCLLL